MSADLTSMAQQIADLTLAQAVELTKILKETHGIEPAAGGGGMMVAAAAAAPEAKAAQTEFTVSLDEAGAQKIQVIKVIREITGLGLPWRLPVACLGRGSFLPGWTGLPLG